MQIIPAQAEDAGCYLVKNQMRKFKFEKRLQFLHFFDSTSLDENNRYKDTHFSPSKVFVP